MRKRYAIVSSSCRQCGKYFQVERYLLKKHPFCCSKCAYDSFRIPIKERFEQLIIKTSACWLWTGSLGRGYGKMKIGGKQKGAHRISYELHFGPIPDNLWVLHRCDNRACVRPDHLFLGTPKMNTQDMLSKGRCNPPIGERQGNHKLTREQVIEILLDSGLQSDIAKKFKIDPSTVSHIKRKKRWAHLW